MRHSRILAAAAAAIVITGCANMDDTQRRTATGAGVGALAGAVIGSATGGSAGTGAVVGAGVGALGTYIWSRNMENQRRSMEQATRGTGVGVTQTSDNQLKLEIPSDISFDTNSSDIRGAFRPLLDQFAQGLRDNPRTDVRIVGHTDSTGSDAVNNPLSVDRAASIALSPLRTLLSASAIQCAVPSGANVTHGSVARSQLSLIHISEPTRPY